MQNAAQGFFGGGGGFAGPLSNSQLTGARESTGQLSDFLPVRLNQALAGRAVQPGQPLLPQVGIRPLSTQTLRNLSPNERETFGGLVALTGIPQRELESELMAHQPLSTSRMRISLAGSRV